MGGFIFKREAVTDTNSEWRKKPWTYMKPSKIEGVCANSKVRRFQKISLTRSLKSLCGRPRE